MTETPTKKYELVAEDTIGREITEIVWRANGGRS